MKKTKIYFIFIFPLSLCILKQPFFLYHGWNKTIFKEGNDRIVCQNCMPAGIKFDSNGTIYISFPRWFPNVYSTFAKFDNETKYFEPWPSIEENDEKNPNKINSILGFEIYNDTIFLLDQGKVNNEKAKENSTKLLVYNIENKTRIKEYIFPKEIVDPENSFLNDIVLDIKRNLAYITDSGIPINNTKPNKPALIILNLTSTDKINATRVFDNHTSTIPDETFWLNVNGMKVYEKYPMKTGIDGIALSCDFDTIFYTPLSSRMLYSINVGDLISHLFNKSISIKINSAFKKEASDGILASKNGNLYFTGIESGSVYYVDKIDDDLLRLDFRNLNIFQGNNTSMWPDTLAIYDHNLYWISNQLHNFPNNINFDKPNFGNCNFRIFYTSVENDENYLKECSNFGGNWGIGTILVWIIFIIGILIVLSFVIMGSNKQEDIIDKNMNMDLKDN